MSDKGSKKGSRSLNSEQEKDEDEKLWQTLEINFQLDDAVFEDNKIYADIYIKPDTDRVRKLIKTFVLVVNDSTRVNFDCQYRRISAIGFDPNRKETSVYIEAIPFNEKWKKIIERNHDSFSIIPRVFSVTPTVRFQWPSDTTLKQGQKPNLVIKWFHIGDLNAEKYVVCLDGKEIQYIRQPSNRDTFEVYIHSLEPGKQHTVQVVARLNNGTETYRSDPISFTVPNEKNKQNSEVIYVSEAQDRNEDVKKRKKGEKTLSSKALNRPQEKSSERLQSSSPPMKHQEKYDETCATHCSCCLVPHESFPGIEHYLNENKCKPSSSFMQRKQTYSTTTFAKSPTNNNYDHRKSFVEVKRSTSFQKKDTNSDVDSENVNDDEVDKDDDDNDVVTSNTLFKTQ